MAGGRDAQDPTQCDMGCARAAGGGGVQGGRHARLEPQPPRRIQRLPLHDPVDRHLHRRNHRARPQQENQPLVNRTFNINKCIYLYRFIKVTRLFPPSSHPRPTHQSSNGSVTE